MLDQLCGGLTLIQPHVSLQAWPWPSRPWSRLHLDFAGPIDNQMILVLIDAHSKWIDAFQMSHATSAATILHLRRVFAQHGIPDTIVTDNGSCFISAEFESFMIQNGIKHITSAPYHAATNGLAERAVQIIKRGLKKLRNGTMEERLSKILFQYRITPQSSTQETPAKLLNGREFKSRLDLIKPNTAVKIDQRQQQQKTLRDRNSVDNSFNNGDMVYIRNFRPGPRWIAGTIVQVMSPISYMVEILSGHIVCRHLEHVKKRFADTTTTDDPVSDITTYLP